MTPDQRLLAIGCYINSALYLTGCFVVSLFVQHGHGWKFALASVAACYCAYTAQVVYASIRKMVLVFVALSQINGLVAGFIVLLGG